MHAMIRPILILGVYTKRKKIILGVCFCVALDYLAINDFKKIIYCKVICLPESSKFNIINENVGKYAFCIEGVSTRP